MTDQEDQRQDVPAPGEPPEPAAPEKPKRPAARGTKRKTARRKKPARRTTKKTTAARGTTGTNTARNRTKSQDQQTAGPDVIPQEQAGPTSPQANKKKRIRRTPKEPLAWMQALFYFLAGATTEEIKERFNVSSVLVARWRLLYFKPILAARDLYYSGTRTNTEQAREDIAAGIDYPAEPGEIRRREITLQDVQSELDRAVNEQSGYNDLPEPWRVFVDTYITNSNNAVQAYLTAFKCGYNVAARQGASAVRNGNIARIIAIKEAERAAQAAVNPEYVLINAKAVVSRCMQAVPVIVFDKKLKEYKQAQDGDGRNIWQFDSKGANQALELIAKALGMLTDNHRLTISDERAISNMSTEELVKELHKQQAAAAIDADIISAPGTDTKR